MKKIKINIPFINAVIAHKGYFNKLEHDHMLYYRVELIQKAVQLGLECSYDFIEYDNSYIIRVKIPQGYTFPIKFISFGNNKKYAEQRAKELCEILNLKTNNYRPFKTIDEFKSELLNHKPYRWAFHFHL